jgi:hypothetical protein
MRAASSDKIDPRMPIPPNGVRIVGSMTMRVLAGAAFLIGCFGAPAYLHKALADNGQSVSIAVSTGVPPARDWIDPDQLVVRDVRTAVTSSDLIGTTR